ncbi:helix-turn-helix transcriptional regulator [Vibrio parahaemolyticus]|nr:helix-turn-helix transcriptional regulator [Vibrio parahaemolyticus]EHK6027560.1 helix-turn-helix transcriptional regulator [Vibrio parahaemolyticus]EIA1343026.1 helix-turn-helix transcriptional regulator [Vibrio parahaemolyticus]EJE8675995.1 helix-turn-helix transcriptional regulator [Vibrio parahaemolyticus]
MNDDNLVLAKNLVFLLQTKGITKSELAREMNVTRQTVQVWLKEGTVSRENLIKLSDFFDTTVSSLVGENKNPNAEDVQLIKTEVKELIEAIPSNHVVLLQYLKKMLS